MNKLIKELPFLAVALLPFLYLAYLWNSLPAQVPMHWNGSGQIDRYGEKIELLYMLLLICGLAYVIFLVLPQMDPKQKLQLMGNKYAQFRFILSAFLSALAIFVLYSVQQKNSSPAFVFVLIGLLFSFLGNYFKTIRPNYFIGIRTPWTLENETVWNKTHQMAGKLWFVGGLLMALTLVLPENEQLYFFLGMALLLSLTPIMYSYITYQKTTKA